MLKQLLKGIFILMLGFSQNLFATTTTFTFDASDANLSTITKTVDGLTMTLSNPSDGLFRADSDGIAVLADNSTFYSLTISINSFDIVFSEDVKLISYNVGYIENLDNNEVLTFTNNALISTEKYPFYTGSRSFTTSISVPANTTISVTSTEGVEIGNLIQIKNVVVEWTPTVTPIPFQIDGISTPFPYGTTEIIGNTGMVSGFRIHTIVNPNNFILKAGTEVISEDYEASVGGDWSLVVPSNLSPGTYSVTWMATKLNDPSIVYDTTFTFTIDAPVVISDTLPTASSVILTGTVEVGQTLTGTYTYNDADGDAESGTSFVWYRSDDASGTNKTLIAGATNNTYTLVSADTGKYISFAVIPSNTNGTGLAVESAINGTAVVVAPTVTPPSTGGGSTGGGSTYTPPPAPTPTPEEPEEEEETVEPIVEEEKVVVQPITEPISEPIVVERQTGNAEQTGTKPELDNVTKLYIATFGRAPESAGSVYWLYESKLNLEDIARSFFDQEETKEKYPEGYSNYDFIVSIYNHVYDRDPDQAGGDYWLEELESGKVEKALFILAVINGAIGDDALMLEKQTIAGVNFVKSGVQNLDMAKKVIDDLKL